VSSAQTIHTVVTIPECISIPHDVCVHFPGHFWLCEVTVGGNEKWVEAEYAVNVHCTVYTHLVATNTQQLCGGEYWGVG
jgi:hypothetical protein